MNLARQLLHSNEGSRIEASQAGTELCRASGLGFRVEGFGCRAANFKVLVSGFGA